MEVFQTYVPADEILVFITQVTSEGTDKAVHLHSRSAVAQW